MHAERTFKLSLPAAARRWAAMALVLLAGVLMLRLAYAAPLAAAENEKQALALATEARNHYRDKDFAGAADLYMQAYARLPEPTLLFNAARAYEEAGKLREALPLFRLYLSISRGDDAESQAGRRDAEGHLAGIEARLKVQEVRPAPAEVTPPTEPAPQTREPAKPEPAAHPPDAQPVPREAGDPQLQDPPAVLRPGLFERVQHPKPAPGWSTQRKLAVATGSVGAALLISGAIVAGVAAGDLDFIDRDAQVLGGLTLHPTVTQAQADSAFAKHASRKAWAGALLGVGTAALGTGIVLWLLEPARPEAAARLWPSFEASAGAATCAVNGRF